MKKCEKNIVSSDLSVEEIDSAIISLNKFRFTEMGAAMAEWHFERLMTIKADHIEKLKTKED